MYKEALLIIEGSYLSSIVSALTSPAGRVSTSASYNYESALTCFAERCKVEKFMAVTFCDSLPYNDRSEIAENKIFKIRKYHHYLQRKGVKIKLGRTEKIGSQYRQEGVSSEIVDTMCFYHDKYDRKIPLIMVTADKNLFNCAKRIIKEERPIIFIGADNEDKNLYFKSSLKKLATQFINLTIEDVLKFKDKPGFVKVE